MALDTWARSCYPFAAYLEKDGLGDINIPLWLLLVLAVLAAWAVYASFLLPGVRWYLRRRANRMIERLNAHLHLQLQPFKLTKRQVLVDRLVHDPAVMTAVDAKAREENEPRESVMSDVRGYAREIVPSFNAYLYFRLGYRIARWFARWLYRVRLGYADEKGLQDVPHDASVVFVMNHRSNMDYVLVAYLAAERAALSYAVGEWARVWPLQSLIRAMGGYFIRRNSGDPLYRSVLARYVAMSTQGGVVQAYYPEGGLSRDGYLRPTKLGLLSYMVDAYDPEHEQDLIFIPVGINYDRVLEDRSLIRTLDPDAERTSGAHALKVTFGYAFRSFWLMARNRWFRFGYACVNFGHPISLKEYMAGRDVGLSGRHDDRWRGEIESLGEHLMKAVGDVVPVLPVSMVATVFLAANGKQLSELELKSAVHDLIVKLEATGARVYVPRSDQAYAVVVGLRMLELRHMVIEEDGLYRANPDELPILTYYANSIAHLLPETARDVGSEADARWRSAQA